ncbi:MAG: M48 family metalloprotease [Cyanobacteria bacterium P01_H01_bin.119]
MATSKISPSGPNPLQAQLKQGLAALKAQNYRQAIALLTPVSQGSSTATRTKAKMGLVEAHRKQGNLAAAIAYCQPLTQSKNSQVKTWASRTLTAIQQQQQKNTAQNLAAIPDADGPALVNGTGSALPQRGESVPSAPAASGNPSPEPSAQDGSSSYSPSGHRHPGHSPSSRSGFAPLENSANGSGFQPFEETAAAKTPLPQTGQPLTPADSNPLSDRAASSPAESATDSPPQQPSLFHYSVLNQPAGLASPPASAPDTPNPVAPNADSSSPQPSDLPPEPQAKPSTAALPSMGKTSGMVAPAETEIVLPQRLNDGTWQWHSTQRLSVPCQLPAPQPYRLWAITALSAIAWFWLMPTALHTILRGVNQLLYYWRWPINPQPIGAFYQDYRWPIWLLLIALIMASPWLWDYLLRWAYGMKTYSMRGLTQASPEAARLIRRICQQQGRDTPVLKILPVSLPVCFSYGCWPRFARIAVSQGLLENLTEDELAAVYAIEMAHISRWDWPIMSGLGLCVYLFHLGYWWLARLGNRLKPPLLKAPLGLISSVLYGAYWLTRKAGLWLSRSRGLESDRQATALTGNPNGVAHLLMKLAYRIHADVEQRGYIDPLLEGLDILIPISPQTVIGLSSIHRPETWPHLFSWELSNPYRQWLDINVANAGLAERLRNLSQYAEICKLVPELPWLSQQVSLPQTGSTNRPATPLSYWHPLLLQGAPYFGPMLGFAIAMILWFIGGVSEAVGFWQIEWFYGDNTILYGGIFMGLGIGTLIRINPFFPDLKAKTTSTNPTIHALQDSPGQLPIKSAGTRIQGQLIGRPGIANWLGQDLLLKTETGLLKLHYSSELGIPGNPLIPKQKHPVRCLGRQVTIMGWFRRGATGWLDIDRLQAKGVPIIHSPHPIFATLISLGATLWSIWRIYRGV